MVNYITYELKANFNKITSLVRKLKCRPNEDIAEAKSLVISCL